MTVNPGMMSSRYQNYKTPNGIVSALLNLEEVLAFDLDPCCSEKNIPAKRHYIEGYEDGLFEPWEGLVFCNPPYDAADSWLAKCVLESSERGAKIWALVPARTDTRYQHDYGLGVADFAVFLKGRLSFTNSEIEKKGGSATFPSMLLYYGSDFEEKLIKWQKKPPYPGILTVPVSPGMVLHPTALYPALRE